MLKIPVTADDHLQGSLDAPVLLVEYGDYECPHCGHAYPIVQQLQKHYGKRMGFVYRNFPLKEIHPNAQAAAETAEFAGSRGKFWEMHDAIFENQESLRPDMLIALAEAFELPAADLTAALESHEFANRVRNDFRGGIRSGVNGTPTFFINGHRYDGPVEFDQFTADIETRLLQAGK